MVNVMTKAVSNTVGMLVFIATALLGRSACAEPPASDSMRAAGWAIIGIGSSLGLGSVASGTYMYFNPEGNSAEARVGVATVTGGVVTTVIALAIGIPMLISDSKPHATAAAPAGPATKGRAPTILAQVLAGEFRF